MSSNCVIFCTLEAEITAFLERDLFPCWAHPCLYTTLPARRIGMGPVGRVRKPLTFARSVCPSPQATVFIGSKGGPWAKGPISVLKQRSRKPLEEIGLATSGHCLTWGEWESRNLRSSGVTPGCQQWRVDMVKDNYSLPIALVCCRLDKAMGRAGTGRADGALAQVQN